MTPNDLVKTSASPVRLYVLSLSLSLSLSNHVFGLLFFSVDTIIHLDPMPMSMFHVHGGTLS